MPGSTLGFYLALDFGPELSQLSQLSNTCSFSLRCTCYCRRHLRFIGLWWLILTMNLFESLFISEPRIKGAGYLLFELVRFADGTFHCLLLPWGGRELDHTSGPRGALPAPCRRLVALRTIHSAGVRHGHLPTGQVPSPLFFLF